MKIRQFVWVRSPRRDVLHIKVDGVREGPAKCGRNVTPRWVFYRGYKPRGVRVCKRCHA